MNVEIELHLDFVEMYKQVSGLRFIETSLRPLVPILAAYQRVLAKLVMLNQTLHKSGKIDASMAESFTSLLENHDAKLQVLDHQVQFLLVRVSSIIQMVSAGAPQTHHPNRLTSPV